MVEDSSTGKSTLAKSPVNEVPFFEVLSSASHSESGVRFTYKAVLFAVVLFQSEILP